MAEITLTHTRIQAGVWEGILTAAGDKAQAPSLKLYHKGAELSEPSVEPAEPGAWAVRVPIPPAALSDGVQTFVIQDAESQETLAHFDVAVGEALEDDLRGELELLRAELDLLKRAFRRHCLETR